MGSSHPGKMEVLIAPDGQIILAVREDKIELLFDYDNAMKIAGYMAQAAYKSRGMQLDGVTILPLGTPPPTQRYQP